MTAKESDSRDGRRVKKRFQFGLRTLLALMFVLGPLSGWYGPLILTHMRDLLENDPPPKRLTNPPITPSQLRALRARMNAKLDRQAAQRRARIRARLAAANRQAAQRRMSDGRNPLINANGTFNMRYHLPPSEQ